MLSEKQQELVELREGRYIINAAAGAGKTKVIVERVKHLIKLGINPRHILCITFTTNAANEMLERIQHPLVTCKTIHALMLDICRKEIKEYNRKMYPFDVISATKQKIMIKKLLQTVGVDSEYNHRDVLLMIGKAKNKMVTSTGDEDIDEVWELYEKEKQKDKLVDFTDMMVYGVDILGNGKKEKYQGIYQWLHLDEAQDTSTLQHEAVRLLDNGNLFIVSSVEQSLYSFRTAEPELILNIKEIYPDITKHELETNYRSGEKILQCANNLISNSEFKTMDMNGTGKDGEVIYLGHFDNIREEMEAVVHLIDDDDTMILYRTNWYSLYVENALRNAGIPYNFISGNSFWEKPEVIDMLCYIKLANNVNDVNSFDRIFNKPNRYLGRKWKSEFDKYFYQKQSIKAVMGMVFYAADRRERGYWGKSQREWSSILSLLEMMDKPSEIINVIRIQLGYDEWWLKECDASDEDEDVLARLNELESISKQYNSIDKFLASIKDMGEDNTGMGVRIGTGHSSKGLEANQVFMVGCMNQLIPHHRNTNYDEERRICYVMMTRARNKVVISSAKHKQWRTPSPFIKEAFDDNREREG